MDVLVSLAEGDGEPVSRDLLLETVWHGQAVSDERLTHVIAELRRVFADEPGQPKYIETIPKRGYRLVRQVEPLGDATNSAIAVLPLDNLTRDPEQEYFADGMTEMLITELSKIGALRVTSRQSVMQFKDSGESLPDIAHKLGVDAVIEGSALLIGGQVRISVQLIDARRDLHIWADSYERDLEDVLAIHAEVARTIAREILVALTPEEVARLTNVRTINAAARRNYLKGQHHLQSWEPTEINKAIGYFEQGIELDPQFADAYAGLAECYSAINFFGFLHPSDYVEEWRSAATQAIDLDAGSAYAPLATISYYYDWDWDKAEASFKQALSLNASFSEAYQFYTWFLLAMARPDEARKNIRLALDLDPLWFNAYLTASDIDYFTGRYDEAIHQLEELLDLNPNMPFAHSRLGWSYLQKGMYAEAIINMERAVALMPDTAEHLWMLGHAYGLSGKSDKARDTLLRLHAMADIRHVDAYGFAMIHIGLGEFDRALEYLETAYQDRNAWMVYLQVAPQLDPLRSDPRFHSLLQRMDFPSQSRGMP